MVQDWSYGTLALASLRANMTIIGLIAAPKIQYKIVRSMQRNTSGLLDRQCNGYTSGVLAITLLSGYHFTPWGVIPKQATCPVLEFDLDLRDTNQYLCSSTQLDSSADYETKTPESMDGRGGSISLEEETSCYWVL
ncbi:hypothetical protein EMCRGX_G007011 [Ephydatia muelleri]